uniref:Polyprotein of retroviral origin, putative n=1 Tax=Ixodes scapularis TaxID=6945 RepID=A0A1S4L1K3_IXOSC
MHVASIDTDRKEPILESQVNFDQDTAEAEVSALMVVLNNYRDCFALSLEELGCTHLTEMTVIEKPGSVPVHSKPYCTNLAERNAIREIATEWKNCGLVAETSSPYASPVLFVKKKNGEDRLVVDFRRLNSQAIPDRFPLPDIDDQLAQLAGAKLFCVLGCANGYLRIPLSEDSKAKTALITPDETGQFEWMIFGLKNGPAVFQLLMNQVLEPLRNNVVMCYLDNILIPARNWEEILEKLKKVLGAIREAGITLKLPKCFFGRRELEYLGFRIREGFLLPGKQKTEAIANMKPPEDVHGVRQFLGVTGFFRRFIAHYATKAGSLSRLLRKNSDFVWGDEQQEVFEQLEEELTLSPVLRLYDPAAPTEFHTDANVKGLAGMLLQQDMDGKWHLVFCVSKKTTDAEKNYHSGKLQLMAILWAVDRLRALLLGIPFVLVTDCQATVYLNTHRMLNPQIARWFNLLRQYAYEVRYRPGKKVAHVDCLSRSPEGP